MSSVGMSSHGLSEKSIVTLTIHDNARTVTKDLYERSIITLTIHANARTVTNMHTQVPIVRASVTVSLTVRASVTVSLTVKVTLTVRDTLTMGTGVYAWLTIHG